jgi:hypothetical protein
MTDVIDDIYLKLNFFSFKRNLYRKYPNKEKFNLKIYISKFNLYNILKLKLNY